MTSAMRFSACAELADRATAIGIIANSAAINLPSRRMVSPSVSDAPGLGRSDRDSPEQGLNGKGRNQGAPQYPDPANACPRPMFQGRAGAGLTMRSRSTRPKGGCACPLAHALDAFTAAEAIRPGLELLPDMAG